MMKFSFALSATAAAFLLAAGIASADQNSGFAMRAMLVADLGHDTTALARVSSTDARIRSAVPPEVPAPERFYLDSGLASIKVHLASTGAVTTASVVRTCGYARVDALALTAVRNATYQPATVAGEAVAGDYLIDVNVTSDR
jgi:TonB family protein